MPEPNSNEETQMVREAIEFYANSSAVDPRLILAVALSESQGCVRAVSTIGGVRNPGLMQSHDGRGDCYPETGQIIPCPREQIDQMIFDGVQGTSGITLVGMFPKRQFSGSPVAFYEGLRLYNSGQNFVIGTDLSTDLNADDTTSGNPNYVSTCVNRLVGWDGT